MVVAEAMTLKMFFSEEKMSSEMEVALRYELVLYYLHCLHCLYYSDCFTLLKQ